MLTQMEIQKLRSMTNRAEKNSRSWYRIENKGPKNAAKVYIYEDISEYGVTADDFVRELDSLGEDTDIDLHLNTPGGNVWDGIAIYNNLKMHKGRVTAYVDSIAASAGSVIAMAADEVVMARNASLMIHNAQGVGVGDARVMRELADLLEKTSDNIADIYTQKAGKEKEYWQSLMDAETFFSAQEAIDEGLADTIFGEEKKPETKDEPEVEAALSIDVVGLQEALKGVLA